MASERTIVDHAGAPVQRSSWRTYLVLLHTLSGSMRIVSRSALGRLEPDDVERVLARWTRHIFEISQLTLVATGVEHVERAKPCVIVGHHESLLDTPCVIASFPGPVRFVGKMELRRVPVFGKAMQDAGIVFVDRDNRNKAISQLDRAKRLLASGTSLWVAAEGTRARDGRLRTFKKGAFHVALELGVPLVPMWIQGTLDVISPDQWRSTTGQRVTVAYGEPVQTRGKTRDDLPELIAEVRARMVQLAKQSGAPADVDALA
jgi:1-acyl-sn-glycerol-3-phosphate acyltransferase